MASSSPLAFASVDAGNQWKNWNASDKVSPTPRPEPDARGRPVEMYVSDLQGHTRSGTNLTRADGIRGADERDRQSDGTEVAAFGAAEAEMTLGFCGGFGPMSRR